MSAAWLQSGCRKRAEAETAHPNRLRKLCHCETFIEEGSIIHERQSAKRPDQAG